MSVLLQSISPLEVLSGIPCRVGEFVKNLYNGLESVRNRGAALGECARVERKAGAIKGGADGKPRVLEARRQRLERRQMRNLLI